jgi:hypothetical protein
MQNGAISLPTPKAKGCELSGSMTLIVSVTVLQSFHRHLNRNRGKHFRYTKGNRMRKKNARTLKTIVNGPIEVRVYRLPYCLWLGFPKLYSALWNPQGSHRIASRPI